MTLGNKIDEFIGNIGKIGGDLIDDVKPLMDDIINDIKREVDKAKKDAKAKAESATKQEPKSEPSANEDFGKALQRVLDSIGMEALRGHSIDSVNSVPCYVALVTKHLGRAMQHVDTNDAHDKKEIDDAFCKAAALLVTALVASKASGMPKRKT